MVFSLYMCCKDQETKCMSKYFVTYNRTVKMLQFMKDCSGYWIGHWSTGLILESQPAANRASLCLALVGPCAETRAVEAIVLESSILLLYSGSAFCVVCFSSCTCPRLPLPSAHFMGNTLEEVTLSPAQTRTPLQIRRCGCEPLGSSRSLERWWPCWGGDRIPVAECGLEWE